MQPTKPSRVLAVTLTAIVAIYACDGGGPTAPPVTTPPTPPVLVSVTLAPDTVDIATDTGAIGTVIGGTSATGLDSVVVKMTGPSASDTLSCRSSTPFGGSRQNGVWLCPIAVPPTAEVGTWRTASVGLFSTQQASGSRVWTRSQLEAAGLGTSVEVIRTVTPTTGAIRWINPGGGAFQNGTNWEGGVAPTSGDTAVIDLDGAYAVTVGSDVAVSRLLIGGGTQSQVSFRVESGSLAVEDSLIVRTASNLRLVEGTVTGPGEIVIEGQFIWISGSLLGTGAMRIGNGGVLSLVTAFTKTLRERSIEVQGDLLWETGKFAMGDSATLTIRPSGRLLSIVPDSLLAIPSTTPGLFRNEGLARFSGVGIKAITVPVVNDGSVVVEGWVRISTLGPVSGEGAWNVAVGGTLELQGASLDSALVDLGPGSEVRGGGLLSLGGRIALRGALDFSGRVRWVGNTVLEMYAPTLARTRVLTANGGQLRLLGAAPFVVTDSLLWGSTSVQGNGTLQLAAPGFADLGPFTGAATRNVRESATVRIDGRAHLSNGNFSISDSSRLVIGPTGRFEISNGRSIGNLVSGGPIAARLENDGSFVKLDTTNSTLVVPFINRGLLDVGGGTLEVNILTNAATGVILGAGTIDASSSGLGTEGTFSPGRITVGGATDTIPGALTVTGSLLSSGASAALVVDLGGTAANTFDVLEVSGTFTASGALRVRGIDGYVPAAGDTLEVLRFGARSGNFSEVTGLDFGVGTGGLTLDTLWTSTALRLVARAPAASGVRRWINPAGGSFSVGTNWDGGVVPTVGDTAIIDLAGTYTVTVGSSVNVAHLYIGTGSNAPTLTVIGGTGSLAVSDSMSLAVGSLLTGAGTIRTIGDAVRLDGGVNVTGRWIAEGARLQVGAGGVKSIDVLELRAGRLRVFDNGFLTVRDTLYWDEAIVAGSGSGSANGTLRIGNTGTALLTTEFPRTLEGGVRLDMDGRLRFGAGTLQLDRALLEVGATGTFEALTAREISGTMGSVNLFTMDGRLIGPPGASLAINVPLVNRGLIALRAGGTFSHGSTFEHVALARLGGEGTVTLNLEAGSTALLGGFEPGSRPAPGQSGDTIPAQLTVGNGGTPITLASSSLVNFAIGGTNATSISRLRFTESVTFAGTLRVSGIGGFLPQPGDRFPVITYQARNGSIPNFLGLDYAVASGGARLDTLWTADTLFLVGVTPTSSTGASISWTGAINDDFHTAGNWSPGRVPGPLDTAAVLQLSPPVRARAPVRVYSLELEAGVAAAFDDTLAIRKSFRSSGAAGFVCSGPIVMGDATIDEVDFFGDSFGSATLAGCAVVLQDSYADFIFTPLARLELRGNAVLDVKSADLLILGDLVVADNARLRMDDVDGLVVVGGNATFGGADSFGQLTDGELQVAGNFIQTSGTSTRSFAPSGGHRTELLGSTPSTVSFASPATGASGFNELAIIKSGGATISFATSNVRAAAVYVFESDVTLGTGRSFTVGNFTNDGTARFTVPSGAAITITGTCVASTIRWTGAGTVSPAGCFVSEP